MIGTGPLTRAEVVAVARHGVEVRLSEAAVSALTASRARVDALAAQADGIYGVSTGFGAWPAAAFRPVNVPGCSAA